jgi:hypothetical protein
MLSGYFSLSLGPRGAPVKIAKKVVVEPGNRLTGIQKYTSLAKAGQDVHIAVSVSDEGCGWEGDIYVALGGCFAVYDVFCGEWTVWGVYCGSGNGGRIYVLDCNKCDQRIGDSPI